MIDEEENLITYKTSIGITFLELIFVFLYSCFVSKLTKHLQINHRSNKQGQIQQGST